MMFYLRSALLAPVLVLQGRRTRRSLVAGSERDRDGDGLADRDDACPASAEDIDFFEDGDGCPDPDNDGDGILDAADKMPGTDAAVAAGIITAEDFDGFQDEDGAPDPDPAS